MMAREPALHPELADRLEEGGTFPMIRHPLVYAVPYFPGQNEWLNESLRLKRQAVEKARAAGNWSKLLVLHERPFRFQAFMEVRPLMSDAERIEALIWLWQDSENIWQAEEAWARQLKWAWDKQLTPLLEDDEDRAFFDALPDKVRVFRGVGRPKPAGGLSWTTDEDKARWFATRLPRPGGRPTLLAGEVDKAFILAAFTGRGESEVVALRADVRIEARTRVDRT